MTVDGEGSEDTFSSIHMHSCGVRNTVWQNLFGYFQVFLVITTVVLIIMWGEVTSYDGRTALDIADVAVLVLFWLEVSIRFMAEGPIPFYSKWYNVYVHPSGRLFVL